MFPHSAESQNKIYGNSAGNPVNFPKEKAWFPAQTFPSSNLIQSSVYIIENPNFWIFPAQKSPFFSADVESYQGNLQLFAPQLQWVVRPERHHLQP